MLTELIRTSVIATAALVAFSFAGPAFAQGPNSCFQCGDNGGPGEGEFICTENDVSGYTECDDGITGCYLSGTPCSIPPELLSELLAIAPTDIVQLESVDGSIRAHARIDDGTYVAWNCNGTPVSVQRRLSNDEWVSEPLVAETRQQYALERFVSAPEVRGAESSRGD